MNAMLDEISRPSIATLDRRGLRLTINTMVGAVPLNAAPVAEIGADASEPAPAAVERVRALAGVA